VGLPPAFAQDAPAAAAPAADESHRPGDIGQRWRIEYERSAQTDGEILLRLWPHNQPPIAVTIPVKQGDTGNGLARTTREILRDTLDKNKFFVEDGQRFVSIVAFNGERRFALELVSNSADGLGIDLERTGR
jgi:hypothetical protein